MRCTDAEDEVGEVDECRCVGLDELHPAVQAPLRSRQNAPVERLTVGVDSRAGGRAVRRENPQQQLAVAAAEVEHMVAGRDRQSRDERGRVFLRERRVERQS